MTSLTLCWNWFFCKYLGQCRKVDYFWGAGHGTRASQARPVSFFSSSDSGAFSHKFNLKGAAGNLPAGLKWWCPVPVLCGWLAFLRSCPRTFPLSGPLPPPESQQLQDWCWILLEENSSLLGLTNRELLILSSPKLVILSDVTKGYLPSRRLAVHLLQPVC